MIRDHLSRYTGGWFVGDFEPCLTRSPDVEVSIKSFGQGEVEPLHHQSIAIEITAVISGTCRIGSEVLNAGDLVLIPAMESADFEALTDVTLVAIKMPSLPSDKVLGFSQEEGV
jgi:hypothetical protein